MRTAQRKYCNRSWLCCQEEYVPVSESIVRLKCGFDRASENRQVLEWFTGMTIWETFSKRKKRLERAGTQDVYQYEALPQQFRVQVVQIWDVAIGRFYVPRGFAVGYSPSPSNKLWIYIHQTIAHERGQFQLDQNSEDVDTACKNFLLNTDTDGALDIIELSFRVIDRLVREMPAYACEDAQITEKPDDAIGDLNYRFREHRIGYQYLEGQLVRVDSEFTHAEVVKPALSLLHDVGFDGAAEEFLKGFDHYRQGRNKEAIAEALKAFESTMKTICAKRKWKVPANATAKPLMDIMFAEGLISKELESSFAGLRSAMESGLPTLSNRTSRHGQGAVPIELPPHVAAYALHLCASNIVFLVQAYKAIK